MIDDSCRVVVVLGVAGGTRRFGRLCYSVVERLAIGFSGRCDRIVTLFRLANSLKFRVLLVAFSWLLLLRLSLSVSLVPGWFVKWRGQGVFVWVSRLVNVDSVCSLRL